MFDRLEEIMKFQSKTEIHYGQNSIDYVKTLNARFAFVVADKLMVKLELVKKVTDLLDLQGIPYEVFDSIEPNPSLETVKQGLDKIIKSKPDLLIAVGGGSVIDAAKAIMYFCIKTKEELIESDAIRKPWFVAIPTTSGTGSEVTAFSVITDTQRQVKIPVVSTVMIPDAAILDPEFTRTVPPFVTADTGMDVLVHAIETYVSKEASDFTDIYAKKAIRQVFTYLVRAYKNGNDMEARQMMQEASCMAGIGFTNAGLGVNHSLAHAVGGLFKISHGRANAILLPTVIAYNARLNNPLHSVAARYTTLAKALGFPADTEEEGVQSLVAAVQYLNRQLEIPSCFEVHGIDPVAYKAQIDIMTKNAMADTCTPSNPRKPQPKDLKDLLIEALY
jgi:acetaldehyde dehydrogenase/alcohol dehydrogenase